MALCVDEFYQNHAEKSMQQKYEWNRLDDPVLYTTHEVFMFWTLSFYFPMYNKIIRELIPTGIMQYLVDNYYTQKTKYITDEEGPKILSLDDLLFGFKIWLGCCFISSFIFVLEYLIKFILRHRKKQFRKFKFEKVHPLKTFKPYPKCKLNTSLLNHFKIKKSIAT